MKSDYDAIVIGSGFGGSMAAYVFAKAGLRTLMLERGNWTKRDDLDWDEKAILLDQRYQGVSPVTIDQDDDQGPTEDFSNEIVGGMSVFYGGASLRLREKDFTKWPIQYGDMEPYYTLAEELIEVHGEAGKDIYEPSRSEEYPHPVIPLTPPAQRIYDASKSLGLHPFQIPLAINFTNSSRPLCIKCLTCDGFPCQIEAKNDLSTTVLKAAQEFDLDILPRAVVKRLREGGGRITGVEFVSGESGKALEFSARIVVVSAGAIQSPAILLRSGLEKFEQHRLIGHYLMRHCNAIVTYLFPYATNPKRDFHKQICLTDFYEDFREQYGCSTGTIQDIYTPSPKVLRHHSPNWGKPLVTVTARYMQNLLCIAEDEPLFENSVELSEKKDQFGNEIARITHRYSDGDFERRDYLVGKARKVLRKAGGVFPYCYELGTFSHAVGTSRFGNDPKDSVLDRNCQFWGIDNLFVLDGSFMPTSGGVNPSLTIAANSLRVAEYVVQNIGSFKP